MSIFDRDKEYALLKETRVISYGEISQRLDVVTFGDTKEELEDLCSSAKFQSGDPRDYKNYTSIITNYYVAKAGLLPYIFQYYYSKSLPNVVDEVEKSSKDKPTVNCLAFAFIGEEIILEHDLYGKIPFIVIGRNHDGPDTITVLSKDIIQLMAFDAEEANPLIREYTNMTPLSRFGNPTYSKSNIHQWLNSDASSGKWYEETHEYDLPPSSPYVGFRNPYTELPGFLNGFTDDIKSLIVPVDKPTIEYYIMFKNQPPQKHNVDVPSKVFLLSATEIGIDPNGVEGITYEYFKENRSHRRIAHPSEYCINHSDTANIGDGRILSSDKGCRYWLRTTEDINDLFSITQTKIIDKNGSLSRK